MIDRKKATARTAIGGGLNSGGELKLYLDWKRNTDRDGQNGWIAEDLFIPRSIINKQLFIYIIRIMRLVNHKQESIPIGCVPPAFLIQGRGLPTPTSTRRQTPLDADLSGC